MLPSTGAESRLIPEQQLVSIKFLAISPIKPNPPNKIQEKPQTYHLQINLRPPLQQQQQLQNITPERQKVLSKNITQDNTSRMTKVSTPSTSFSPFRNQGYKPPTKLTNSKSLQKLEAAQKRKIDWHQPALAKNASQQQIESDDQVLNETINKLDFLEKKIARIMEKNEQLRSILKRPDFDDRSWIQNETIHSIETSIPCKRQTAPSETALLHYNIEPKCHYGQIRQIQRYESIAEPSEEYSRQKSIYRSEQNLFQDPLNSKSRQITPKRVINMNGEQFGSILRQNNSNVSILSGNKSLRKDKQQGSVTNLSEIKNSSRSKRFRENSQSRLTTHESFFKNGRGKKIYENGDIYEGEWANGQREGLGTLFGSNSTIIYQGEWKQDKFHGRGRLLNENYQPMVAKDLGVALKNFANLKDHWRTYEGELIAGHLSGLGVLIFQFRDEKIKYHGNFQNDVFHGSGTVISEKDGRVLLNGFWKEGVFQ